MSKALSRTKKGTRRRDFGSVYQRGRVWYARWTERGRLHSKAIGLTKSLAERFLATKRADLDRAEALGVRPVQHILFEDLLEDYPRLFSGQKSATTIKRDLQQLRARALRDFRGIRVEEIRQEDIERFLTKYVERGGLKPASRNRMLSLLSGLFRRAVRLNHMRDNPCRGIPRVQEALKDVLVLTAEDQARLVSCLKGALRNAAQLTLDTGLRLGELLRLDWQDIDFERGTLTVRVSKNKTPRTIPFGARGREALTAQRELRGDSPARVPDCIFTSLISISSRTGEPDFTGQVRHEWNLGRKQAGFPALRWHDLRHVFAVTAVRAGVPFGDLRNLLGHKSLVMVMRYARHSPVGFEREARDRMDRYLQGDGEVREVGPDLGYALAQ